jgi:hypothetical protein
MKGGQEDGVVAGIGMQPNGELAQMARLVYRLRRSEVCRGGKRDAQVCDRRHD